MEPLNSMEWHALPAWKEHNHVISASSSLHLLGVLMLNRFNRYLLASHGSIFFFYWWAIINDSNDPKCHKTFKSSAREKDCKALNFFFRIVCFLFSAVMKRHLLGNSPEVNRTWCFYVINWQYSDCKLILK